MDYDTYSANDAIGRIYFDLNPLVDAAQGLEKSGPDGIQELLTDERPVESIAKLLNASTHTSEMNGWLPILDTLNGTGIIFRCTVSSQSN